MDSVAWNFNQGGSTFMSATAPTLSLTATPLNAQAGETVTVTATSNVTNVTFTSTATLSGTGLTRTFTAPSLTTASTVTVTAVAANADGVEVSESVSVNVAADNVAPVANAGPNQSNISTNALVLLDGSLSSDINDTITYSWRQTAGTTVTLIDANLAVASFRAPALLTAETLTFELTATDSEGETSTDSVDVYVLAEASASEKFIALTMADLRIIADEFITVYPGRSNTTELRLKPYNSGPNVSMSVGGFLDFAENNITKVEVLSGFQILSSANGDIAIGSDFLRVDFGKLSSRHNKGIDVVLYADGDTKGIVVDANGKYIKPALVFRC